MDSDKKRYSLLLPLELYDELERVADSQGVTVVEIIRKFIKLGVLATKIEEDPERTLILKENDTYTQILML